MAKRAAHFINRETRLLKHMQQHEGQLLSRAELGEAVGMGVDKTNPHISRALCILMARTRKLAAKVGCEILTIYGTGFMLRSVEGQGVNNV